MTVVLTALTFLVSTTNLHPDPFPGFKTSCTHDLKVVHYMERQTHYMQEVMGVPRSPVTSIKPSCPTVRPGGWRRTLWGFRWKSTRLTYHYPPNYSDWLCIHHYEGAWTDPNPPYYGGLQMDYQFMETYAPELLRSKGTADHWTPLEQIWTAEIARRSGRGFFPWPNTARMCGLI